MNFKYAYRFPLHVDEYSATYVNTDDNEMAFTNLLGYGDGAVKALREIVDAINGHKPGVFDAYAEDGCIFIKGKKALLVRGWGHLTGCCALNLPLEEAARIQVDFTNYCVQQLRRDLEEKA